MPARPRLAAPTPAGPRSCLFRRPGRAPACAHPPPRLRTGLSPCWPADDVTAQRFPEAQLFIQGSELPLAPPAPHLAARHAAPVRSSDTRSPGGLTAGALRTRPPSARTGSAPTPGPASCTHKAFGKLHPAGRPGRAGRRGPRSGAGLPHSKKLRGGSRTRPIRLDLLNLFSGGTWFSPGGPFGTHLASEGQRLLPSVAGAGPPDAAPPGTGAISGPRRAFSCGPSRSQGFTPTLRSAHVRPSGQDLTPGPRGRPGPEAPHVPRTVAQSLGARDVPGESRRRLMPVK